MRDSGIPDSFCKKKGSVLVNFIIAFTQQFFQTRYTKRGGSNIVRLNTIVASIVIKLCICIYLRAAV